MDKGEHLLPSGNVVKCFVHCRTLSRRIIYALFSQPVVSFWSFGPKPPPGLHLCTPLADFRPQPLICPPLEKILREPMVTKRSP